MEQNYYENHCYTCQKDINNVEVYFSMEWDAYVCKECMDRIINGEIKNVEEEIIAREFKHLKEKINEKFKQL